MKSKIYAIISMIMLSAVLQAYSLCPFSYTQDFESGDPVSLWVHNATYTVNSCGPTTEMAHSGSRSYKLDVTFQSGTYLYFCIPFTPNIPVRGNLKLSAYIYVPYINQGNVGIGANFIVTPGHGCCGTLCAEPGETATTFTDTGGQWIYVEGNVVNYGTQFALGLTNDAWGINPGDYVYMTCIPFFLLGAAGQRITMYIDDLVLEGDIPANAEYDAALQGWTTMTGNKVTAWNSAVTTLNNDLNALGSLSAEALTAKNDVIGLLTQASDRISAVGQSPSLITRTDQTYIDGRLKALDGAVASIEAVNNGYGVFNQMRIFAIPPISDIKVLPSDQYIPGLRTNTLNLTACPGEYEPASFVVKATSNISALTVSAGNLTNDKGALIAADNVDIKLVKCWYQAGTAWTGIGQDKTERVLVPELLLNDDALVSVNHGTEDNYVRGSGGYIWISDSTDVSAPQLLSVSNYAIQDSATLQPLALASDTNQQYWLTVHVPANTAAGKYSGTVTIADGATTLGTLTLNVEVQPFTLDSPYYTASLYYRGQLSTSYQQGTISSEYKSEQQLTAELNDMFKHGVGAPIVYQPASNQTLLGDYIDIMQAAGGTGSTLYYIGGGLPTYLDDPNGPTLFAASCASLKTFFQTKNISTLYCYGVDECSDPATLEKESLLIQAAHSEGVNIFQAGSRGVFDVLGNLLDMLNINNYPLQDQADNWHSTGKKIWSYSDPQAGVENPLVYRRNFGLALFQFGFDGHATYAYQHSCGNIWNDFDHPVYRDLVFTYPTVDGVIDTIAWEGYREGVDDVRYLTTLQNAITNAQARGVSTSGAEAFLENLDVWNADYDLDTVRSNLIDYILETSLVARWEFDETAGIYASDSSENANTGTLKNDAAWTNSGNANVISLDGIDAYVNVPDTEILKYQGGNMTLSMWIYINSTETTGGYLLSKPWNGSGQYNYWLRLGTDNKVSFALQLFMSGSNSITSADALSTETWHHVKATVNSAKEMKLYVDGTLVASGTHSVTDWTPTSGDLDRALAIGTLYPYSGAFNYPSHAFDGLIDDVLIYR